MQYRVELRQAVLGGHRHGQAHGLQPGYQGLMVVPVAGVGRSQALFLQHQQGLVQGVDVVDRRRVVVGTLAATAPVTHHQLHIQEPALHLVLAILDALHGAGAEGDRRQAGDTGQAFLGAGVDRVGAPGVHQQLDTAQGGDRVDDGQGAAFPRQCAQGLGITAHAGGGLRVDEGQDGGVRVGVEGGCHLVDETRAGPSRPAP